jgi:hypothetical protein
MLKFKVSNPSNDEFSNEVNYSPLTIFKALASIASSI